MGCEWNVLNGLDYHDRPPCLRGARLAETNDGNRLEPFRVDVTSLALASLRSRSGKPLEPSFHHLGRPKCRYHWGLVLQIGMGMLDWVIRTACRLAGGPLGHVPVARSSEHVRRSAVFSELHLGNGNQFKIHAPSRESRACDTRYWRTKSQGI